MKTSEFLSRLRERGAALEARGDKLEYVGPEAVLTASVEAYIKRHKSTLIAELLDTGADPFAPTTVSDFVGVSVALAGRPVSLGWLFAEAGREGYTRDEVIDAVGKLHDQGYLHVDLRGDGVLDEKTVRRLDD